MVKQYKEIQRMKESFETIHEEIELHEMVRKVRGDVIVVIVEMANQEKVDIENVREKLELIRNEKYQETQMKVMFYNYNSHFQFEENDDVLYDEKQFCDFYKKAMFSKRFDEIEIGFVYEQVKSISSQISSKIRLIHFCHTNSQCKEKSQMLNDRFEYYCLMFKNVKHPYSSIPFVKNYIVSPKFLNSRTLRCFLSDCSSQHCRYNNGKFEWKTEQNISPFEDCECHHGVFIDFVPNKIERPTKGIISPGEINIQDSPFGVGSVRVAFHGYDMNGDSIIVKQYKSKEMMGFESYVDMVSMHLVCQYVAELFEGFVELRKENKKIEEMTMRDIKKKLRDIKRNAKKELKCEDIKKISFIPLRLFIETERNNPLRKLNSNSNELEISEINKIANGRIIWFVEKPLIGTFIKYNSNSSDVNYFNYSNTMQCFSHFSYFVSAKSFIITDLQGIYNETLGHYELTDPAIHHHFLSKFYFAFTNLGENGINQFFLTHKCNKHCVFLNLPPHFLQPTELYN